MHNFTVCGTIFAATAADVIATVGFGTARSLASFAKYAFGTSIFGQQAFYDTLVAPVPRIVRMRSTFMAKKFICLNCVGARMSPQLYWPQENS